MRQTALSEPFKPSEHVVGAGQQPYLISRTPTRVCQTPPQRVQILLLLLIYIYIFFMMRVGSKAAV